MNRNTSRFTDSKQAGHDCVRIAVPQRHDFTMIIGWDAAHIIMDCRHHRQRLPRQINACENLARRSEEHTSELQSLMRISYAVLCLKQKKHETIHNKTKTISRLRRKQLIVS